MNNTDEIILLNRIVKYLKSKNVDKNSTLYIKFKENNYDIKSIVKFIHHDNLEENKLCKV